MIRYRPVLAAVLLVAVGSGCGVGVDAAPRPLEPISTVPPQPVPTVALRPDDRPALCLQSTSPPVTTPDPQPSTPPPTTEQAC